MNVPTGWKWGTRDSGFPPLKSCTRILYDPHGRTRATVTPNFNDTRFTWFVWDENGVGGENDVETDAAVAMYEASRAMDRWGWSNEAPPPPLPQPLSAEDVDRVEEALRDTYGDADEAGAFSQHVVEVLRAYERLRNE